MKKFSLLVALASICLAISPANAQSLDTTKNKVEIKKKTKVGANGQQETKIKMESKGTPEAVTGAVESTVTGKAKAATPATPATPATVTSPATPAQPASPSVIVVHPETVTKVVTVPVKTPVTTTKTTTTTINRSVKPATRKVVRKPVTASSTTTTTTTVKKEE